MSSNGRMPDSELAVIAGGRLAKPYALRWNMMNARCRANGGGTIYPTGPRSTYRTYYDQVVLRNYWCARGACGNAAIPGQSNHGLGRAVDTGRKADAWRYGAQFGVRPPTDAPWETWHVLVHLDRITAPKPNLEPTLRKGVINRASVAHLQRMLRKDNIKCPLNSKYDLATRQAVRRFQKAHHLPVDSVVGPKTWAMLHKIVDH